MIAQTSKKAFYAAVGAPVVAVRKAAERVSEMRDKLAESLSSEYEAWAKEGESVVAKIADRQLVAEFVEDMGSRVDLEHIQDQVGRLRQQLDEMLSNWRESFRPVQEEEPDEPEAELPEGEQPEVEQAAGSAATT